ncbi:hypothetical protein HID58_034044 [Brassica napus]|uniref:Uncharacterized protein n=1 Tax=Brassica napus TaxID=3708 RepID=A0ABQ8C116_BRANA|nr:hypothetical protein HID58_034044 [Brassica napus]
MLTLRRFDVVPCNKNFRLSDSLLAIWFRRQDTTCEDQSMFSFALQCRRSFKGSSRSKEEIQNYLACGKEGTSGKQTKRIRVGAAQWVFFSCWFDGSEERTAPTTIHDDDSYDSSGGEDCDKFHHTYRNIRKSRYEGGDNADDDDNPDGIPVPVQVETGEGSSDAVKDADEKADDHAPKKRIHSSTNAAKIVHV